MDDAPDSNPSTPPDPPAAESPPRRIPPSLRRPTRVVAESLPRGVTVDSVKDALEALPQTEEKGWLHVLLGLGISLVLFLNLGFGETPGTRIGIITVVILIHEAGHFIGMKIFNYRNVRMFFIPFFGAVVTAQDANPDGWKRAAVILLGPLPGIFIGCILSGLNLYYRSPVLSEFALIFLGLNVFNLLPFQPLDGGRFFQEVVFCRNYYLEAAFAVLSGGALAAFAFTHGEWLLAFVGTTIVLSASAKLKLRRLAVQQRALLSTPDAEIEITEELLHSIRKEFPALKEPKNYAVSIKQIREKARQIPPAGWATAGYLLLYAGSFVGVVITVIVCAVVSIRQYENKAAAARQAFEDRDYPAAESQYREALEMSRSFGNDKNLRAANAFFWIAASCARQKKFEEAEKNFKRTVEIREKILGPNNAQVANALRFRAMCLDKLQRPSEASALRARADEIDPKPKPPPDAEEAPQ